MLKWKGPTGKPEKQGFFERFLHFPTPHYSDRRILWAHFISDHIFEHNRHSELPKLNYSTLAQCTEGYSAGSIKQCVLDVLSDSRKHTLSSKPLAESEFLEKLPSNSKYPEETSRLLEFTRKVTNLDARKKALEDPTGKDSRKGAKKKS